MEKSDEDKHQDLGVVGWGMSRSLRYRDSGLRILPDITGLCQSLEQLCGHLSRLWHPDNRHGG
jgi:hypothetical protein